MNSTEDKLKDIIDKFDLNYDLNNNDNSFNNLFMAVENISYLYEKKLNEDISNGKLDIRRKEIALDIFSKYINNIIKNKRKDD